MVILAIIGWNVVAVGTVYVLDCALNRMMYGTWE